MKFVHFAGIIVLLPSALAAPAPNNEEITVKIASLAKSEKVLVKEPEKISPACDGNGSMLRLPKLTL